MKTASRTLGRAGFTLIEILVSLILLAVLAAAVFPVVTQQIGAADAPTLANDLSAVKTALDTYNANTGTFPGDIEDLVYKPASTVETDILGDVYTAKELRGWNGPYIEIFMADSTDAVNLNPVTNAFGETVNAFACVKADVAPETDPTAIACEKNEGHFVSAQLTGLSVEDFLSLNDVVDLSEDDAEFDTDARRQRGKLRCALDAVDTDECASVYYLATPYTKR